jgi:hypothetical protein
MSRTDEKINRLHQEIEDEKLELHRILEDITYKRLSKEEDTPLFFGFFVDKNQSKNNISNENQKLRDKFALIEMHFKILETELKHKIEDKDKVIKEHNDKAESLARKLIALGTNRDGRIKKKDGYISNDDFIKILREITLMDGGQGHTVNINQNTTHNIHDQSKRHQLNIKGDGISKAVGDGLLKISSEAIKHPESSSRLLSTILRRGKGK